MIDLEKRALQTLAKCSMRIASGGKRFRNDMLWKLEHEPDYKLTLGQALLLWGLVDMYRRQIQDEELLRHAQTRKLTGELPEIYLDGDLRELPKAGPPKMGRVSMLPARCAHTAIHEACGGKKIFRCQKEMGHAAADCHSADCFKHKNCVVIW